jgi:hypothetical protein
MTVHRYEEVADRGFVDRRPPPKLVRPHKPVSREDAAYRIGFPVLGAVVAVAFTWLLIHFL